MKAFVKESGIAAPLMRSNVDTDAIIPSREYQSVARTGFAEKLFANWRYATPGGRDEVPGFVLNREPYRKAVILVSGPNFGCGSSREWAVWTLAEFGIRCVIAESFGAIFRSNCIRNGLLPVELPEGDIRSLVEQIEKADGRVSVTVDLEACVVISPAGERLEFKIDPKERTMLLQGLDEIGITLQYQARIDDFIRRDKAGRPWMYLERNDASLS